MIATKIVNAIDKFMFSDWFTLLLYALVTVAAGLTAVWILTSHG